MLVASLAALLTLAGYTAWCAVQPFSRTGRLRIGRRALNYWRRTHRNGTR